MPKQYQSANLTLQWPSGYDDGKDILSFSHLIFSYNFLFSLFSLSSSFL